MWWKSLGTEPKAPYPWRDMIVIHIVNGRQPQNNGSLWPPGHKQLHTNVIIEISAGKRKTGKNFEREESANAFITHTPCVRNAKWQKMMKNLFANQPYQLWPYFPPPPLNAISICWPFVPNNSKGKKRGLDGQKSKPNQTLFDAIDAVTLCAVALPHDIHIYIYSPLFTIRLLWFYCFV